MTNNYRLYIRNNCINPDIIHYALTIVRKKDLSNLTIIITDKKDSAYEKAGSCTGLYVDATAYTNPVIHIYLERMYDTNKVDKKYESKYSFYKCKWNKLLRVLYHEIGHHHQTVVNRLRNTDKYNNNVEYERKCEKDAVKYENKMFKKAQKYFMNNVPHVFTTTGYFSCKKPKIKQRKISKEKSIKTSRKKRRIKKYDRNMNNRGFCK